MPLAGRGAGRQKAARELAAAKPQRKPSWAFKGLSRFERVVRFVQSLPVTKGPLAGKRIKLLPGQLEWLRSIYAAPHPVTLAILSEPRGNGKTGLLQALSLCHLLGPEAQPRGEVYAAAMDRKQASAMFNECEATLFACPDLHARVNIKRTEKVIEVMDDGGPGAGSRFEAMSGDARKGHGLAPSFWCYDELARVPSRELLDALLTGRGKRKSLGVIISTQAPDDDHPLSQLIDDAPNNPATVCKVSAAPKDSDWTSPDVLRSVNPALGSFLDEEELLDEQRMAVRIPSFQASFRNLRLNQRIDAREDDRLVTASVWLPGAVTVDRTALRGRTAFGGLDLASVDDLCAFALVIPDDAKPAGYDVLAWFWTPADQMAKRSPAERERFQEWRLRGFLKEVPGGMIPTATVAADLVEICHEFDVRAIAYDRWRIEYLKKDLAELGVDLPMEAFGQGHSKAMAPAVTFLRELAFFGRLRHGGNPVLTASVVNAVVVPDRAGNPMIDKPKSNSRGPVRIDGAIALLEALSAAKGYEPPPPKPSLDSFLRNPVFINV